MNEREEEWTEAERTAIAGLARERMPSAGVEERVVATLRRRGLLRRAEPSRQAQRLRALAAAILLLAVGYAAGRAAGGRAAEPSEPRFALLLLRGQERVDAPAAEAGRVAEYRAWARDLARRGRYVHGEKLEDRSVRLAAAAGGSEAASAQEVRGFFIISAASLEDALAVARACPHLKHGGTIVVRPIADTGGGARG
jgi:hypothetical protein